MDSLRGQVAAARKRGRRHATPDLEAVHGFEVDYEVSIQHRGTVSTPDPTGHDVEEAIKNQLGGEFAIVAVTATRK